MKLIFAYNCWEEKVELYRKRVAGFGRSTGLQIMPFCLTPDAPRPRYSWSELDRLWNLRHRPLIRMFSALKELASDADILWVYNGANFHPEWISKLPERLLTIYGCFDDPEASPTLSAPVAPYFDACLVGNIASIPQYQGWGCANVEWGPIFIDTLPPDFEKDELAGQNRPVDLVFCGERQSQWRRKRLDFIAGEFPAGHFFGRGWPGGYIGQVELKEEYKSSKIGINIHNSTGPINKRLFELPAHGVMQVCDNRCRLGHIFELGKEAVGFDNVKEAAGIIRHYLNNENERLDIAWNGYKRVKKDYSPEKLWRRYERVLTRWKQKKDSGELKLPPEYRPRGALNCFPLMNRIKKAGKFGKACLEEFRRLSDKRPPPAWHEKYVQTAVNISAEPPYFEKPEKGPVNLKFKMERVESGNHFEWPNMVALNWAVASMVGGANRIIEVGSGTGCFAYEAGVVHERSILCLEADENARKWAEQNRRRPNIAYRDMNLEDIKEKFDLFVAIDVIEHIDDFRKFLKESRRLSIKAIITTPNRFRQGKRELSPSYQNHVREWSAGEFYWILRCYWPDVKLYSRPDVYVPLCVPVDVNTEMNDLIGICSEGRNR